MLKNTSVLDVSKDFIILCGAFVRFLNIFKAIILEFISSAFVLKIENTFVIKIGVSKIKAN